MKIAMGVGLCLALTLFFVQLGGSLPPVPPPATPPLSAPPALAPSSPVLSAPGPAQSGAVNVPSPDQELFPLPLPVTRFIRRIAPLNIGFPEQQGFAVSPDGRWLSVDHTPGEKGENCSLVERSTHRVIDIANSAIRAQPIVFSRDSRYLFVWCYGLDSVLPGLSRNPSGECFIGVYNIARRRFARCFAAGRFFDIHRAALSQDGRSLILITGDSDFNVFVTAFDTRTGHRTFRRKLLQEEGPGTSVALRGDGRYLMQIRHHASRQGDYESCSVRSVRTGREISELKLPSPADQFEGSKNSLLSADGRTAGVYLDTKQQWLFFDIRTQARLWTLERAGRNEPLTLMSSATGEKVFVGLSDSFEIRSMRSGKVLRRGRELTSGSRVAWSGDDKLLYTLRDGGDFEPENVLWQYRVTGTQAERQADERSMVQLAAEKKRFARSPAHIDQSLLKAAYYGDPNLVTELVRHGANIEARDREGYTPICNALHEGGMGEGKGPEKYVETVKALIALGAKTTVRANHESAMSLAMVGGPEMMKLLFAHGADVDQTSQAGWTALHHAAMVGYGDRIRLLLEHGANPDSRDNDGVTPLMRAADRFIPQGQSAEENEAIAVLKLLLAHGADVNARDKAGRTVIQRSFNAKLAADPMSRPNKVVERFLREAGAK